MLLDAIVSCDQDRACLKLNDANLHLPHLPHVPCLHAFLIYATPNPFRFYFDSLQTMFVAFLGGVKGNKIEKKNV